MASSDVVLMHSAFDALRFSRSAQTIGCRRLQFWTRKTSRSKENSWESLYSSFMRRCTNMYKITEHPFVIRFMPQTTIDEVIENALIINLEKFMLRKFDYFQALANTNLELLVVVGQFQYVQILDLKDATVTSQVVVRFVIEPVVVYLSLWDDAGAMFRGLFNSGERAESVMVVTTVNPKIFGGNLYLSSTPATKFYFDLVLQAITDLEGPVGEVFPFIDTKDEEIKKKEFVSIGDLNKFISNSDDKTHEADFICKARVVEVLQQNGRSFVSCSGCSTEFEKSGTSLHCNRCVNPNVTEVIKEILKLTKQDAAALTLDEMANLEAEASGIHESVYQLPNHNYSSLRSGKYSECSTSASSDVFEDISEEDEPSFHDTIECFSEPDAGSENMHFKRRTRLPDPAEKEKGVDRTGPCSWIQGYTIFYH
ncbi:hypothetical protein F2Q69_00011625 [Brassica cretica]|uniref:Replication factor A C-terminal domain-containing protein n=1 Tax=Brassica cretica TaxID=69181 RepID=A0A8S9QQ91_BRACR|nr:hypothetical protein F2Q69_00011625 [Brassica cretica]